MNNTRTQKTDLEYIGEGTYGCAFRPPLKCKRSKNTNANTNQKQIGKIFKTKNDMNDELENYDDVKIINAESRFTTKLGKTCEANNSNLTPKNMEELYKCSHYIKNKKLGRPIYQMFLEDGGKDLKKTSKSLPFMQYFVNMRPLFVGIQEMKEKKVTHQDIKPSNIVYNPKTERMLYIDFGLISSFDTVLDYSNMNFLSGSYIYYPPEYRVIAYCYELIRKREKITAGKINSMIDKFDILFDELLLDTVKKQEVYFKKSNYNSYYSHNSYNSNNAYNSHDIYNSVISNSKKLPTEVEEFILNNHKNKRQNALKNLSKTVDNKLSINNSSSPYNRTQTIFHPNLSKIDVYGLGISILECLNNAARSSKYLNNSNNNSDLYEWSIYRTIYKEIFILINNMVHPNPFKRYTSEKSLAHYDQIIEGIKMMNK